MLCCECGEQADRIGMDGRRYCANCPQSCALQSEKTFSQPPTRPLTLPQYRIPWLPCANPLDVVWKAFVSLYPAHPTIEVFYQPTLLPPNPAIDLDCAAEYGWGYAAWVTPSDGSPPTCRIALSTYAGITVITEIFAHELAHAVTPDDHSHGTQWNEAFINIMLKYNELMMADTPPGVEFMYMQDGENKREHPDWKEGAPCDAT